MASQRQIFFVALLLFVALVSQGGEAKRCKSSKDCPRCHGELSRTVCLSGKCFCFNGTTTTTTERRLQEHAQPCNGRSDCVGHCRKSCDEISCENNFCFCTGCN